MAAAELIFADSGYDGASVRAIMNEAGVQLSLLSYHFGTKEALLEAVIARRAPTLAAIRTEGLENIPPDARSVEQLVDAYHGAVVDLATGSDPGWHAYFRLLSSLAQVDRWIHLFDRHFVPTSELFIERLYTFAPDVPRETVLRSWVFGVSAAVVLFAGSGRIGAVNGRPTANDFKALNTFIVGGLKEALGLSANIV